MKTYVEKTQRIDVHDKTYCDKCNNEIRVSNYEYDVFSAELIHKNGNQWPEGGSGKIREIHLCQHCIELAINLLKANGFRVNTKEWET